MVANLAEQILLPTYEAFAARAAELGPAVDAYCAALGGKEEAAARTAAQDAWRAAMLEWQAAELMLLGPAAMDDRALRDVIYSWPVTSTCAVDREVMERHLDPKAYDMSSRLSNRRGLPALEHVLFSTSLEHTCPAASPPEGWDALAEAERRAGSLRLRPGRPPPTWPRRPMRSRPAGAPTAATTSASWPARARAAATSTRRRRPPT